VTVQLALVTAAIAAGVLLPKALPALLASGRTDGWWGVAVRLLPAATVGGLAALAGIGPGAGARVRPEVAAVWAAALAGALLLRWVRARRERSGGEGPNA
jgi:hypothetical protein